MKVHPALCLAYSKLWEQTTELYPGPKADHCEFEPTGVHLNGLPQCSETELPDALSTSDGLVVASLSNKPQSTEQSDPHVVETPQSRECSHCKSHLPKLSIGLDYQRWHAFLSTMQVGTFWPQEQSKVQNPCCPRAMLRELEDRFPQYAQFHHTPRSEDQPSSRTDTPTVLHQTASGYQGASQRLGFDCANQRILTNMPEPKGPTPLYAQQWHEQGYCGENTDLSETPKTGGKESLCQCEQPNTAAWGGERWCEDCGWPLPV